MSASSAAVDAQKKKGRSRITNGSALLPADVDGRSPWARRFRDLIEVHLGDLGGRDACSEAERSIVRRVAALEIELERLEYSFACAGEAKPETLDLYQRTAGTLRRLLVTLGLERRARDVTPDPLTYAQRREAAS